MKKAILSLLIIFLGLSILSAHGPKKRHHERSISCLEHIDIDMDDGTLILKPRENDDVVVEITHDYRLYVDGDRIYLNDKQERIVKRYYDLFGELLESAKRVGIEGAKIGLRGAAIGLEALAGLCKLIDDDYDQEDLERELEIEADKLKIKAEELKYQAEELKEVAEELEDIHDEFVEEIPQVRALGYN